MKQRKICGWTFSFCFLPWREAWEIRGRLGYAAANAFMDVYAARRNRLVRDNKRSGQTLSVNWPLWEEGGMRVDKETERLMYEQTGMKAMRSASGIQALYAALPPEHTRSWWQKATRNGFAAIFSIWAKNKAPPDKLRQRQMQQI